MTQLYIVLTGKRVTRRWSECNPNQDLRSENVSQVLDKLTSVHTLETFKDSDFAVQESMDYVGHPIIFPLHLCS
jgi:RPA family protein